jgi:hypothetical protein
MFLPSMAAIFPALPGALNSLIWTIDAGGEWSSFISASNGLVVGTTMSSKRARLWVRISY